MINRVVLMGRLVADTELKTTASGISVTTFRIAVDRAYVKSGEERQADFIDIVAWRHTAEFICKHFRKGSLIAVDGSLQSRVYEKDGNKRYAVEVVAENASFTGERAEKSGEVTCLPSPDEVPQPKSEPPVAIQMEFQEIDAGDDLPF